MLYEILRPTTKHYTNDAMIYASDDSISEV